MEFFWGFLSSMAAGAVLGWLFRSTIYRHQHGAAIKKFSDGVGKLIRRSSELETAEPPLPGGVLRQTEILARSIVKLRNDYRTSLEATADLLNSEIDRLEGMLAELDTVQGEDYRLGLLRRIRDSLAVLETTWPEKSFQIELATRKLLVELGLEKQR